MIKLGLIGCGYWGKNHLRTLREMEGVNLAYVCDSQDLPLKLPENIKHVKEYIQILADSSIEGVVIATPTNTHYAVARDFLNAKKHVFVEKPLATNVRDAQTLCSLAETNNIHIMVGEIFRFNPAISFIKSLIDSGELGELRYLEKKK